MLAIRKAGHWTVYARHAGRWYMATRARRTEAITAVAGMLARLD